MKVEFFIPWNVQAKQGDRVVTVIRKGTKPITRHHRDPKVQANHKALVTLAAQHRPDVPMRGPIRARFVYQYPWRKSESHRNRLNGCIPKDTRPDLGNLDKQLEDVLEAAGFFVDDAQIAERHCAKVWADNGGVQVTLEEVRP